MGMRHLVVLLALAIVLAAAGCGKRNQAASGPTNAPAMEMQQSATTESTPVTESEFGAPVYPGATRASSEDAAGIEGNAGTVTLVTKDGFEKVIAWYRSHMDNDATIDGSVDRLFYLIKYGPDGSTPEKTVVITWAEGEPKTLVALWKKN